MLTMMSILDLIITDIPIDRAKCGLSPMGPVPGGTEAKVIEKTAEPVAILETAYDWISSCPS